jgi:hypothetical protein
MRTEHPKWQIILTQIVQYVLINSRITGNNTAKTKNNAHFNAHGTS